MQSPEVNKTESREVAVKSAARRYASELLRANLLVPQTYGAIRTLGARSLLTETMGGYDFSVQELIDALDEIDDEVKQLFAEQMHVAHEAANIKVTAFENKTPEEIFRRAGATYRYHELIARDGALQALKFVKKKFNLKTDDDIQEKAVALLDLVSDALVDERLREAIRSYKLNVMVEKLSKDSFDEQLAYEWGKIFMQKLRESPLAPTTPEGLEALAYFFTEITDPIPRVPESAQEADSEVK